MTTQQKELEREIARLYKQGQTDPQYDTSNTAMTLMMLYINKKFNIAGAEPFEIEEIRRYGRCTSRQKKLHQPTRYSYELDLHYDSKNRVIKSNEEEYYAITLEKLTERIDANPGKKIFYPFEIAFYKEGETPIGHVEVIIYDPVNNTLEHIDPNYLPKQLWRKNGDYFACQQMSEEIISKIAANLESQPRYINNSDIYTGYECGIQSLESASDKVEGNEKKGYCLMWTSLLADLALSFPECSMKDIIRTMLKKSNSKQLKVEYMNDYFLYMIRGYVIEISRQLDVTFTDVNTAHEACVRLVSDS